MKTAVVTGASTGIGRATAIELGSRHWQVFLTARNKPELEKTRDLVEKAGGKGIVIPADLSKARSVQKLIDQISSSTDQINMLANIAAIWHDKNQAFFEINLEDYPPEVITQTMFVGVTAPILLTRGLLPLMISGSHIINVTGIFSDGGAGWIPYYVSKRALEDFTVALSEELKSGSIRVNCISPSDTATEQYSKYFPKYAHTANTSEFVAKVITNLFSTSQTGKFTVVRLNQTTASSCHT